MPVRNWRRLFLFVLPAVLLPAQSSQLAGPVSGYVFDQAASGLRPVLGIPGSSLLGDPLDFGFGVSSAVIAPLQDSALVTAANRSLHLFRLRAGAASETIVNGLESPAQRVVFSPSGTAAALYAHGLIQILTGLPDAPAIAGSVDVRAAGIPTALALSDDGNSLLVASGTAVELYHAGGDAGKLADTAGAVLLAFAPGRPDAAVADLAGAGVTLYRNLGSATNSQVLAPPDDTIRSGTALAFSADGQRVLLSSLTGQSVSAFNLADASRNTIACSCSPTALARMGSFYRLNDGRGEPLWLLDDQPGAGRIVFVPSTQGQERRTPSRAPGGRTRPLETRAPASSGRTPLSE